MLTFLLIGWFPSEMTTGGSDDNNESTPQDDAGFQQEMESINARVPPGRMGQAKDLASVSDNYLLHDRVHWVLTLNCRHS